MAVNHLAVLGLCLLSVAFFWKVVVLHRVLLPGDILYAHDPLWRQFVPHSFTVPANPLDSDELTEFYPWAAFAARALHQGIMPLWNPYAFAGTPFLAAMQAGVLYPINLLLEWLVSPIDVLGLRAIVHLALALVGTFLFARRLSMSYPAALLAALAFGLSTSYIVWIEHPIAGAIAWLPWLLLCLDYLMATRGSLRWIVATAAVLAVEMLAGHGESSAHVLLLCLAFVLYRTVKPQGDVGAHGCARARSRAPLRVLLALAAAAVLGFGVAAAHLLPTLAQLPLTEAAADRALATPIGPLGDPAPWQTLVVAAVPDFYGNPTWGATLLPDNLSYNEVALYAGAITLFLAVIALMRRHDGDTIFFGAVALAALGVALRLPILSLVGDLPVLRVASNGRLRIEYAFAIALLAGYGLDALTRGGVPAAAWRLARIWWLALLLLVVVALAGLLNAHPFGHVVPLATAAQAAWPLAWLSLFLGALWLHGRGLVPAGALHWLAPGLVALDLFVHGVSYHTTIPRAQALRTPPAVRAVEADRSLYRVAGLGETLMPSLSVLYGLQDVRGYDPAYDVSYERYFGTIFSARSGMRLGLAAQPLSPARMRAFNLMNVRYIFVACDEPLHAPSYHLIYHGGGCVYRNDAAMPRAVLVHQVAWAAPERAVMLLGGGIIDPRRVALLDPATAGSAAWRTEAGRPGPDDVRVTHYGIDDVALDVRSGGGGLLVLTDAYAPGWQARIDGRPVPIARADAVFRAVAVTPGSHTVLFSYQPPLFESGVIISVAACALWLLLAVAAVAAVARRQKPARLPGQDPGIVAVR